MNSGTEFKPTGLSQNQVHVWWTDVQSNYQWLTTQEGYLTEAEKRKSEFYILPQQKNEYKLARHTLRNLLSHYLPQCKPEEFSISKEANGKPFLERPLSPLTFNLSHSQGTIAIAIALNREAGIDVETTNQQGNFREIAQRFFSPTENYSLNQLNETELRTYFLEIWTLKESYLKARGLGLNLPLDKFSFQVTSSLSNKSRIEVTFQEPILDSPNQWHFELLKFSPDKIVAVAVKKNPDEIIHVIDKGFVPNPG